LPYLGDTLEKDYTYPELEVIKGINRSTQFPLISYASIFIRPDSEEADKLHGRYMYLILRIFDKKFNHKVAILKTGGKEFEFDIEGLDNPFAVDTPQIAKWNKEKIHSHIVVYIDRDRKDELFREKAEVMIVTSDGRKSNTLPVKHFPNEEIK
jgi:hypothetical protein